MAASNAGVFRGARISSTRVPRRIRNITSEELIGYNSLTTSEKPGSSSKETVVQQLSSLSQICSDPVVGVLILKKLLFAHFLEYLSIAHISFEKGILLWQSSLVIFNLEKLLAVSQISFWSLHVLQSFICLCMSSFCAGCIILPWVLLL